MRSSRYRVYRVSPRHLVRWFNQCDGSMILNVPTSHQLPDDAYIAEVHNDIAGRGLQLIVESDEFDVVPSGGQPYPMPLDFEYKTVSLLDAIPERLEIKDGDCVVFTGNPDSYQLEQLAKVLSEKYKDLKFISIPTDIQIAAKDNLLDAIKPIVSSLTVTEKNRLMDILLRDKANREAQSPPLEPTESS